MAWKEHDIQKVYYTIGEVAKLFNVTPSLIRFWEKEFDIIKPKRNAKSNRLFTPDDMANFRVIYHLVKERGFTLEGAKKHLHSHKDKSVEEVTQAEAIKTLLSIRELLVELRDQKPRVTAKA